MRPQHSTRTHSLCLQPYLAQGIHKLLRDPNQLVAAVPPGQEHKDRQHTKDGLGQGGEGRGGEGRGRVRESGMAYVCAQDGRMGGVVCSRYAVLCGCYAVIYSQSGTCPRCVHCQQVTATLQVMTHNKLTHNELTHVRLNYDTNCQVW